MIFSVFILGLVIGSFLNALLYRTEVQQELRPISHDRRKVGVTVLKGRSFCPNCGHQLVWQDLFPVISFLLLQGKCRYCKKPISWQYPLVELATAFLFVVLFWSVKNLLSASFPQGLELLYLWVIGSLLLLIFVYDLKHFLIPDTFVRLSLFVIAAWRLYEAFSVGQELVPFILASLGSAGFFLAIFLLSKGKAMGFGDVKLALVLGLFLGWPNILVALFVAFVLGALVGLVLIAAKRKGMKSEVPFGPFLIVGTLAAFLWGQELVNLYMSFVLR
jgi:leader peptidase (prepilin peptidase) / N-methyltransferase